jgi:uncharacterized OB-fold protein
VTGPQFPFPDLADPDVAPFWAACREERLIVRRCGRGHLSWPPRPACPRCQDTTPGWQDVVGTGWLYSWTIVHRTPLPAFRPLTPYVVGVVELTGHPGLRLLGRCLADPGLLRIGLPVRVTFEHLTDELSLPLWRGNEPHLAQTPARNTGSIR